MYLNLEWDSRYTDEPQWPPTLNEEIVDEIGMDDDEAEAPGQLIPRLHLDLLPKADEGGKRTSLIRGKQSPSPFSVRSISETSLLFQIALFWNSTFVSPLNI